MKKLSINQTSKVSGGMKENHYDSSFITLSPGECYISNLLGVTLCDTGIYDLDDNLMQPMKPAVLELNGYEIDISISKYHYTYFICPNILR